MHVKIQQKKREIEEKRIQREEKERLNRIREEEEFETKARKDTYKEEIIATTKRSNTFEEIDIDDTDPLEENPAKILKCSFCQRSGQRKKSGRLIPFRANQFIHTNCALWTNDVFDNKDGYILNFYFSYKKARLTKCTVCNELGASIS